MKAMLISEMLEPAQEIKPFLKKYDFDLIHYRSPIKAMDNLAEISPDAVIINTIDFPRHWKVISQHIRWDTPKENVLMILLINEYFSQKDADKATNSGVQGMIKIKESLTEVLPDLKNIFDHYKYIKLENNEDKNQPFMQFMFVNPENEVIITGIVKDITPTSISFLPDTPAKVNLQETSIITNCSLQINTENFFVDCMVRSNNAILDLLFVDMSDINRKKILNQLA